MKEETANLLKENTYVCFRLKDLPKKTIHALMQLATAKDMIEKEIVIKALELEGGK